MRPSLPVTPVRSMKAAARAPGCCSEVVSALIAFTTLLVALGHRRSRAQQRRPFGAELEGYG